MGTSRSGSVGSSTRWKVTRDDLKALAEAVVAGVPRSIPQLDVRETKSARSTPIATASRKGKGSGGGGSGGGVAVKGGAAGTAASLGGAASIAQSAAPRTIRALGKQLAASGSADKRFNLQLGDCAVKVAIEVLLGLLTNATIKYRTQRDTEKLSAEYGLTGARNVATALARALDQRYREGLIKKCKKATDAAEKARQAMQRTLIDLVSPDGTDSAFLKLNADAIHTALRKTNGMRIVERFYANFLFNSFELLVSSLHADISRTAEKNVLDGLRVTYCDEMAKQIVKRAQKKGWRPSEIPDKAEEWDDLLVEEEVNA